MFTVNGTIPYAVTQLPHDDRTALPVPYSSGQLASGRPDFTTVDGNKARECAMYRLCGMCGNRMCTGQDLAFLGTLKTLETTLFYDPPMHPECARAALTLCPHIAHGRDTRAGENGGERTAVLGWALWLTRDFQWTVTGSQVIFVPAPMTGVERYFYGLDGVLARER